MYSFAYYCINVGFILEQELYKRNLHLHVLYKYASAFTKCYSFLKYNKVFSCPEFPVRIEQTY